MKNYDSYIADPSHTVSGRPWPFPDNLWMVTVLSNPLRWKSRYHNYFKFARHMKDSGVNLITVELAYGERAFEVTAPDNPLHVQMRSRDELWHKENLLNLGFERLPLDVKYFGYSDADFIFTRSDWAQEVLHQLQHYDAVQPFSSYSDITSENRASCPMPSFAYNYLKGNCTVPGQYGSLHGGAPGGAWCFRTEAFNAIGGMLDTCILGSGDWHMAMGMAGKRDRHTDLVKGSAPYVRSINIWKERAACLNGNIGVVDCHALHHWHGDKKNRHYVSRSQILKDHRFDPYVDIKRDFQGVYQLTGNKPALRDAVRAYFRSRFEDDPTERGRKK